MEVTRICELLNQTFSSNGDDILSATTALDQLSVQPEFLYLLLSVAVATGDIGLRKAAASYMKNCILRNIDGSNPTTKTTTNFREPLVQTLLQAEQAVAKILAEPFRHIVIAEFVKENTWPELVPSLQSVISNSNLICGSSNCHCKTVNALIVLQSVIRPFQYFFNPKVAQEPVPPQLELIATEILKPLITIFHRFVDKAMSTHAEIDPEVEEVLHIISKCIFFAVKSHMPSALPSLLPIVCQNLCRIISSIRFNDTISEGYGYLLRLKTAKRSFLVLNVLIIRHWKYSDRLLPDIVSCAINTVKSIQNISKLNFPSERIASLALDVIANALEHGPGWRLISPHFSSLLESVVFPALVLNEKDIMEWEEDPDEYLRKNLPSDLEEASESKESLFTARKSAINLLGVISKLKGPSVTSSAKVSTALKRKKGEKKRATEQSVGELLVLPFLSKFPIPTDAATSQTVINNYYGVLMAYGGLQDYLKEQKPQFIENLIRSTVLALYATPCAPYLIASANWVLGELASCLPQDLNRDIYSSLLKGLVMPKYDDISSYPVCVSAAGAITNLLESDYLPPEWLPVLQVLLSGFGQVDEIDCILFKLLSTVVEAGNENVAIHIPHVVSVLTDVISKNIPPFPQPWPQTADQGFEALAVLAKVREAFLPEEDEEGLIDENLKSDQETIARAFSSLLQKAWLISSDSPEDDVLVPSCMDDLSVLLLSIIRSIKDKSVIQDLKVSELLLVWANLIADWHSWDDFEEDLSTFVCIKEVVGLHETMEINNFLEGKMPPPPAPPVPMRSIIEGICVFLTETILQFPAATWKACSCVHTLLNAPIYSPEFISVRSSLAVSFCKAAFSRFVEFHSEPCSMWKPLLLAVSSCYVCFPDDIELLLEKETEKGFSLWISAMISVSKKSKFSLTAEPEIKLAVLALARIFEQLLGKGILNNVLLRGSFASLMEAAVWLKEVQEEEEETNDDDELDGEDENEDDIEDDEDEEESDDDDEDSESIEPEETDEQFLARYAEAAAAMENNGTVDEDEDTSDEDADLDLGCLDSVDPFEVLKSLVELHRQSIMQIEGLPSPLVTKFMDTFPEYSKFFLPS